MIKCQIVLKGVATRFQECSELSIYVHCYGHVLSLATKDCLSEITLLRNTLGTIQALYVFLEASPKRHALFMKSGEPGEFVRTLKSQCATRWTAAEGSRKAVEAELMTIIRALHQLSQDQDSKISSEATSLLIAVSSFDFLFGMSVLKIILPHTSHLSAYVQSVNIDVLKVKQNADLVIKTLESCRSDDSYETVWQLTERNSERVKAALDENDIDIDFREAKLPRQRPSTRRLGTVQPTCQNTVFSDVKEFHKITHYFPALDKIIMELTTRFGENDNKILCSLGKLLSLEQPDDETFKTVSEFYKFDEGSLRADHKLYTHAKKNIDDNGSASSLFKQLMDHGVLEMIPTLGKALKVFAVIPATSCSSERSFSSLRRLKTYLRSMMGQERLSNLAILHIETEFVNKVLQQDMESMINTFGGKSGRNTKFF